MTDETSTPEVVGPAGRWGGCGCCGSLRRARSAGARVGGIARSAGISIILVLSVICLVLTPVVVWGRNLLLNTDRYVQTVEPLASNPGVQNTVIAAVDAQFQGRIDLKSVLDPVLPPRAAQVLVPPLQGAADSLVNTVTTKFVQSDAFKTVWQTVNRVAHTQINYLLTGQRPKNAAVQVAGNGDVTPGSVGGGGAGEGPPGRRRADGGVEGAGGGVDDHGGQRRRVAACPIADEQAQQGGELAAVDGLGAACRGRPAEPTQTAGAGRVAAGSGDRPGAGRGSGS